MDITDIPTTYHQFFKIKNLGNPYGYTFPPSRIGLSNQDHSTSRTCRFGGQFVFAPLFAEKQFDNTNDGVIDKSICWWRDNQ